MTEQRRSVWWVAVLVLATASLLLLGRRAHSATCRDGQPSAVVTGHGVPCDGIIISDRDAIRLATQRADLRRCRADLKKKTAQTVLRVALDKRKLAACHERVTRLEVLLRQAAQVRLVPRPWYEHPAFVASVSVIGAVGSTVLIVWALGGV